MGIPVEGFEFYGPGVDPEFPGYLPPEEYWPRMKALLGKRISVRFRVAPDGLSVVKIVDNILA